MLSDFIHGLNPYPLYRANRHILKFLSHCPDRQSSIILCPSYFEMVPVKELLSVPYEHLRTLSFQHYLFMLLTEGRL